MKKSSLKALLAIILAIACMATVVGCGGGRTMNTGSEAGNTNNPDWGEIFGDSNGGNNNGGTNNNNGGTNNNNNGGTNNNNGGTTNNKKPVQGTTELVDSNEFKWPEYNVTGDTINVLTVNDEGTTETTEGDLIDLLKEHYGIKKIVYQGAGFFDIGTKFQAMWNAGDAPDMVYYKLYEHTMNAYALKGMIRPVEEYVDFNNKNVWGDLKPYFTQSKYNGHNYILLNNVTTGPWIYYNKKIFKDCGVEDLWTTYKKDPSKWDWNKLEEIGKKVTQNNPDGSGNIGLITDDGMAFFHTTGQLFGSIGTTRETTKINMKNQSFARAAEFITKGREDGWIDTAIHGAESKFASEAGAMIFCLSAEPTGSEDLIKRGDVGIVPMAKDPESEYLWNYKHISGYYLPTKSKNPAGAAAYTAVMRYLAKTEEQVLKAQNDLRKKGWTDLMFEQVFESDRVGKPIVDMAQSLGYTNVWNCLMHQHTWASTFTGETQDVTNLCIDEIFAAVE